ncbi:hypothetical protein T05_7497 [Trichinella murrelli]|uniref:Uncharacterized protein n=1 Tax=Trichinella murrelli TaxID=144512 RepID=A0A0V0SZG6_9BILA|nr:hypothetical protein T05_7497 [Trichinella murrelli]
MHPTAQKVEEEEAERGKGEKEEDDQLQQEANLLSVHSTMILNLIPQMEVMHPIGGKMKLMHLGVGQKVEAVKTGEEEGEDGGRRCKLSEQFSYSRHPGKYCDYCFRTLNRLFRKKFKCSDSECNLLMLPDGSKLYLLTASGSIMFRRHYVQVESPYEASTFCTAAKYPSERFNFSDRDEISRKVLKMLYFKHHYTRKGKRNPKRGRGT